MFNPIKTLNKRLIELNSMFKSKTFSIEFKNEIEKEINETQMAINILNEHTEKPSFANCSLNLTYEMKSKKMVSPFKKKK